jgi:hypothetical protein
MPAFTAIIPHDNTTLAGFQNWVSGTSTYLSMSGLVRLQDYRTLVTTSIGLPSVANSASGFEIYTFNDGLQATAPAYIKIEYGGGSTTTKPAIWVTVSAGSATDGSGSFFGNYTGSNFNNQTSLRPTTPLLASTQTTQILSTSCYFSGDGTRIQVSLFTDVTLGTIFFGVERTKDTSGNDTSEGLVYYSNSGTAASTRSGIAFFPSGGMAKPAPQLETAFNGYFTGNSSTSYGGLIASSFLYPIAGNIRPPAHGMLLYVGADFATRAPVSQSLFSSNRVFLPLGTGSVTAQSANAANNNLHIAMRFD